MSCEECFDVGKEIVCHNGAQNRWVLSHRQVGKFLLSPPLTLLWEKAHMPGTVNIQEIRKAIQAAMDRRGIKAKPLAKAAGLNETAVRDILQRSDNPGIGTLLKIADVLEVPASEIFGGRVPMLGKIGAGGSILFEEEAEPQTVDAPPASSSKAMMALLVVGDSMMPVYRDGDIVYVRRLHDGVLPHYLGEECAIRTADGGTWLKTLSPGTQIDRYTLRSFNAADMENVEVIWATPVLFVQRHRKPPE